MQQAILPSATLAEFYRYALLVAGDVYSAQGLLASCLAEAEAKLAELRSPEARRRWLAIRLRQRCIEQSAGLEPLPTFPRLLREDTPSETPPDLLQIEAYIFAQRFHQLPEPERSALAFFYLDLFDARQIADILHLDLDELAAVLGRARVLVQEALRQAQPDPVP